MITIIGIDSDPVFLHLVRFLAKRTKDLQVINLRAVIERGTWSFCLGDCRCNSFFEVDGKHYFLSPEDSFFARLINLSSVCSDKRLSFKWDSLMLGLSSWLDHIPGKVINRPKYGLHNAAKPLHEHLLQTMGFRVPSSITTSSIDLVRHFCSSQKAVLKALSGVRCNSQLMSEDLLDRYREDQGPVHLQTLIKGDDIRVHVVGNYCFPETIYSDSVDYRTASKWRFKQEDIPASLSKKLIHATQLIGLEICGWDFVRDKKGEYWCLEANPMPGYAPYDRRCGGAISQKIMESLKNNV